LEQHKDLFDEERSKMLYQRKQAELKWLQKPSQINGDYLTNVRRETSRTFRKKKHFEEKINELEKYNENTNIRDLYVEA
jgi:hypothetical protein